MECSRLLLETVAQFVSEANAGPLSVESFATDPNNANNLYLLCGSEYLSSQKTAVLYSNDGEPLSKSQT